MLNECLLEHENYNPKTSFKLLNKNLEILQNELRNEMTSVKHIKFKYIDGLTPAKFNSEIAAYTKDYIKELSTFYVDVFNKVNDKKLKFIAAQQSDAEKAKKFERFNNNFQNDYLKDIVTNSFEKKKMILENNRLVQIIESNIFNSCKN